MAYYQEDREFLAQVHSEKIIVEVSEKSNRHLADSLARNVGGFDRAVPGTIPVLGSRLVPTQGSNKAGDAFDSDKQGLPFATVTPILIVAGELLGDPDHPAEVLCMESMNPSDLPPSFRTPQFFGWSACCRPRLRLQRMDYTKRFERPKTGSRTARIRRQCYRSSISLGRCDVKPWHEPQDTKQRYFGCAFPAQAEGSTNQLLQRDWNMDRHVNILEVDVSDFGTPAV